MMPEVGGSRGSVVKRLIDWHPINTERSQVFTGELIIHSPVVLDAGIGVRAGGLEKLDVRDAVEAVANSIGRSSLAIGWIIACDAKGRPQVETVRGIAALAGTKASLRTSKRDYAGEGRSFPFERQKLPGNGA